MSAVKILPDSQNATATKTDSNKSSVRGDNSNIILPDISQANETSA